MESRIPIRAERDLDDEVRAQRYFGDVIGFRQMPTSF